MLLLLDLQDQFNDFLCECGLSYTGRNCDIALFPPTTELETTTAVDAVTTGIKVSTGVPSARILC